MDYHNNGKRLKTNNFNTKTSIFGFYHESNHDKNYRSNFEQNQDNSVNCYKQERDAPMRKKHNNFKNVRLMNQKNVNSLEYPPFSRLFILYPKEASESELNNTFQKYGLIQDISIIKDPITQIEKGLFKAYHY